MGKKILVTTDLSANSKAGIRFAIQLSKQTGASLTFYLGVEIDKPTRWGESQFNAYVSSELEKARIKLKAFIDKIYGSSLKRARKYEIAVERSNSIKNAIVKYAAVGQFDFICMGTRGAGPLKRILGTTTSAVITNSTVPVFAIPRSYRSIPIKHLLYASDLNDISIELKKVKRFADTVKSKVTVLHYDYLYQLVDVQKKFHALANREKRAGVKFYLEPFNIEDSLSAHVKKAVSHFNPSILVLFTKQNRDWYERIFLSSKSAEISFESNKPLLIYPK